MQEGYGYWPPSAPPQPVPRPRVRVGRVVWFLAVMAVVMAGVATYVLLQRLDDAVLTVIATVGCAAGVALPALLMAVVVLVKRAENGGRGEAPPAQPQMTQPMVVVVPPTALPQYPQVQQPGATWDRVPVARQFRIVGDGEE